MLHARSTPGKDGSKSIKLSIRVLRSCGGLRGMLTKMSGFSAEPVFVTRHQWSERTPSKSIVQYLDQSSTGQCLEAWCLSQEDTDPDLPHRHLPKHAMPQHSTERTDMERAVVIPIKHMPEGSRIELEERRSIMVSMVASWSRLLLSCSPKSNPPAISAHENIRDVDERRINSAASTGRAHLESKRATLAPDTPLDHGSQGLSRLEAQVEAQVAM